jgi:prepilin-type N-terminal cleavage/methylation domain-containing protein
MTDKTHRAFTLVELLIVIAIIALLVALLFPALSRLDIIKKETACQRNLREIQRVFAAYATMNDGKYPYPVDTYYGSKFIGSWTPKNVWAGLPHVSQMIQAGSKPEMWFCPFDANYGNWDAWPMNAWERPYHPNWSPKNVYVYIGYTIFIYRGWPYGGRFSDTRPTPIKDSAEDDIPLAADQLFTRANGGIKGGWHHGGGIPDGMWNSDCFTVFKSGAVRFTSKNNFDWDKPALVIGSAVDYWWFALNLKD